MTALFLWDIDGTLLRGGTTVHRDAFAHAFQTVYGVALSLDGTVAAGRTDRWLLHEPLRRLGLSDDAIRAEMPRAFAVMAEYVDQYQRDIRTCVLPGVVEVLLAVRASGSMQGLLTGNLSGIAHSKLAHAGLNQFFATGGFGEESETRSDLVPVAMRHAAAECGRPFPPDHVVVIGDTPLDVEAGWTHGTRTVAIATGTYDEDALRQTPADLVLPSLTDAAAVAAALLTLVEGRHSHQRTL